MTATKIITISGASGAGKTSVVRELANRFASPCLLFDDHVDDETYPRDMKAWYETGSDVSLIKTPTMLVELDRLVAQRPQLIFVEEPFGRERQCIGPLVDYAVLLDVPLEICLSRIIRRNLNASPLFNADAIQSYLTKYESHLRNVYLTAVGQVRNNCDLVASGTNTLGQVVNLITDQIRSNLI